MAYVTVLGSVSSRHVGPQWETLAPSARQLLAILVAAGPAGLTFERAADELWPQDLPATWDAALRMALTRLRKRLPPGSLTSRGGWCRLEVPVNDVDVWHLAALARSTEPLANPDDIASQLAHDSYPSVEISQIIRSAIDEFDLLRSILLGKLIEQNVALSPVAARRLCTFAEARDWDTMLNQQAQALSANVANPLAEPSTDASPIGTLPRSLLRRRANPLLGQEEAVDRLLALVTDPHDSVTMLAAEAKSGRSATLAEVGARLAEQGWRVIHLEPGLPPAAFGPLIQALPQLRTPLLTALESDASPAQIRSRCWTAILQALDHPVVPTCVIVDDAELLDSNSDEALAFIGRGRTTNQLAIVMACDSAHPAIATSHWMKNPLVQLRAADPAFVQTMVAAVHPHSSDLQRMQLGGQISALAGQLPGHAFQLVAAVDAETLTLPPVLITGAEPVAAAVSISPEVLPVAGAAEILRSPVSLSQLEHVTRIEPHQLLTAVDELLGVGILIETSRPDVFEWAPVHRHSDFAAELPPHELARFHRRAMALSETDPVALATHALRAQPLVSDTDAIEALLAAATSLVASQSHREAVANFRAAEDLGADMETEQLIAFATSLEFVGTNAIEVRERAVAKALANGDAPAALGASLAGLPRAEQLDGDEARVKLIQSIDPSGLARDRQLQRLLALSRQLLLLSRKSDALGAVMAARELMDNIEEEADVWLAAAHIDGWLPEGTPKTGFEPIRFAKAAEVNDPTRRARLHQAAAVSAMIAGDFPAASAEIDLMHAAAHESGDPLRIWHAGTLRAAQLTNDLQLEQAERTADEAREYGVTFGLSGAVPSRLAQASNWSVLCGSLEESASKFQAATPDAVQSLLGQAGTSLQLSRAGRVVEASGIAERVLHASAGSRFELAVAGILSDTLLPDDADLAARIAEVLEPHRGQLLVVGAGLTVQGPIETLLADVTADQDAALELRHEAVGLVDGWESPLWQIVTRITLAMEYKRLGRLEEHRTLFAEAAERAAGTEFAEREGWGLFET